jgi:hypothetical protein
LLLVEKQKVLPSSILQFWVMKILCLIGYMLQAETDAALKNLKELEIKLASKHKLELEVEQLKGKLEVMKHMGVGEDTELEIENMRKALGKKDAEMDAIDSLNQTLIIKQRRTNDELEDAKKELTGVSIALLT